MKNRKLIQTPTWKIALRLGLVFIIVVNIIQFFWSWIETGNLNFIPQGIENGTWVGFLISRIFLGTVYGFVTAYFMKRQARK
jgi:hypothetical protein